MKHLVIGLLFCLGCGSSQPRERQAVYAEFLGGTEGVVVVTMGEERYPGEDHSVLRVRRTATSRQIYCATGRKDVGVGEVWRVRATPGDELEFVEKIASPVPKPPPPPPDPIQPGYRWMFSGYVLEVVEVQGDRVRYRCCNRPRMSWGGCDGYTGANEQNKARVRKEQADYRDHEAFPVEPDV